MRAGPRSLGLAPEGQTLITATDAEALPIDPDQLLVVDAGLGAGGLMDRIGQASAGAAAVRATGCHARACRRVAVCGR